MQSFKLALNVVVAALVCLTIALVLIYRNEEAISNEAATPKVSTAPKAAAKR